MHPLGAVHALLPTAHLLALQTLSSTVKCIFLMVLTAEDEWGWAELQFLNQALGRPRPPRGMRGAGPLPHLSVLFQEVLQWGEDTSSASH